MKYSNSEKSINEQTLYQEFCRTRADFKPSLKEIITLVVKNLLDLSKSLICIHSHLNSIEKNLPKDLASQIENWNNEAISSALSQRRSFSRLISDLKYMIGSFEGADEIFLHIDQLTAPLRQDWSPSMTTETGNSLRKNFLDLILIIDPHITGSIDNEKNDLGVIKERLKEVERTSLTFLDMNSRVFKDIKSVTDFFKSDMSLNLAPSTKGSVKLSNNLKNLNKKESEEIIIDCDISSISQNNGVEESMPSLPISLKAGRYENINDIKKKIDSQETSLSNFRVFNGKFKRNASVQIMSLKNDSVSFKSQKSEKNESTNLNKVLSEPNLIILNNSNFFTENKENVQVINKISKLEEIEEIQSIQHQNFMKKKTINNFEEKKASFTSNSTPINFESNQTFAPKSQKKPAPDELGNVTTYTKIDPSKLTRQPLTPISSKQNPNINSFQKSPNYAITPATNTPIRAVSHRSITNTTENLKNSNGNFQNKTARNTYSNLRVLNPKDITPVKTNLTRVMSSQVNQWNLPNTNNNSMFNSNIESQRSRNLSTNRSNSSIPNHKISYKRIQYSSSRSPIISHRVYQQSSSSRREFSQANVTQFQQNSGSSRIINGYQNPSPINLKSPINSDRVIRRIYKSGSQTTTPLRINYNSIKVHPVTPHKFVNGVSQQYQGNNSVTPIKGANFGNNVGISPINQNKGSVVLRSNDFSSFNLSEFLNNRKSEKLHIEITKIEKITVSNNGNYLLFGGAGLHVLDMAGNNFKLIRFDKNEKWKFNSIKVLSNDNILITQPMTNDLIVLDSSFKEIKRIKGIQGDSFDNEAIRNSRCSKEGENFIWFRGGNIVSIVDTITFSVQDIKIKNNQSLPLAVACNSPLSKMMILTVVEDENIYLNYWENSKTESMESRYLNNACSNLKAAMCLEISKDEKTVFVGGCNSMDIMDGKATISAVHFNQYMVNEANIELHDPDMKNIFQIRRYEESPFDVLIVGGFNSLSIVEYKSDIKKFFELKLLKNLHNGEVFDFCVLGREIFSICPNDEFIHKF